jgi:hypothetical protein
VTGIEELCVGKLCALLSRSLPRDLYDAVRLPRLAGEVWSAPGFRALLVGMAGSLDHPLHSYGRAQFLRTTDERIRQQLHPVLQRGDRPSAELLREEAWRVVEPFLHLTPAEREYSDRIQSGELRPELLFPDDQETARRLASHPALLWKARNSREHAARAARSRGEDLEQR